MDIALARTFLMVAETGSFIDTGRRMNLTQSTVSARIKNLEDALGQPLFERTNTGAELTTAGQQFRRHALTLVRVWQHAQFEVGLSDSHRDHLAVGAPQGLWTGFLLDWVGFLRKEISDIAVTATADSTDALSQRISEGTLDLVITYRPLQHPGLVVEHLFDDVFARVVSAKPGTRRNHIEHVFVNWGAELTFQDAVVEPEFLSAGLTLDLGASGLEYMLANPCSGYMPMRVVSPFLKRNRLRLAPRARKFSYPVYMAYPETRDEEAYEPILRALRKHAEKLGCGTERALLGGAGRRTLGKPPAPGRPVKTGRAVRKRAALL